MPVPVSLQSNNFSLRIQPDFTVAVTGNPNKRIYAASSRFVRRLSNSTGIFLDKLGFISAADTASNATLLIHIQQPGKLALENDESYSIETKPHQLQIDAVTDMGAIHGLETILQLVSSDAKGYYIPGVIIKDNPRFAWRGLLLDVALHFMPVEVLKRTIDGMAVVKMNVLHLHLCNDQGFRVESKLFPRLQQVASDGMYYTQEEIKAIIRYADERGIRIVPEFVVPAHTTAILTAYPEFASVKRNYHLQRYFGVFDPVMDPTNEKLYPFLASLYGEMAALFPDAYFHIGGDENTGKDWEQTPHIKAFMNSHGMKTAMDLQTWFNQRLLPIVKKTGKTMIGWDEVFQPGLPKEIVVQSWRGNEAFYNSVKMGHKAILSYGYYIDLIQPASYHYSNDPVPVSAHFTKEQERAVLGGEATMWSELVTPLTVDSRIWPRTAVIAERLWSAKSVTDIPDMYRRMDIVSEHLEAVGLQHIAYKLPLMRQMTAGNDTRPLEILGGVIEPLKIYERNQGDTMYSVFSPFTKIADLAIPDPSEPRLFNALVQRYLAEPDVITLKSLKEKLLSWQANDSAFQKLIPMAPQLQEAAGLSKQLFLLATAGLEALEFINQHKQADNAWLNDKKVLLRTSREQGGRCELQVVDGIQQLIEKAAG